MGDPVHETPTGTVFSQGVSSPSAPQQQPECKETSEVHVDFIGCELVHHKCMAISRKTDLQRNGILLRLGVGNQFKQ